MSTSPPARPCCVCFRFRQHEDEKAQKNTFTRWINFHLEEHSSSGRVEDLFEDIRDGVLLCHLIEVLTGEALAVHKGRVSKRVHHVANLTTALAVLRRRGLELINNNAADLADGNPRIVLGLIWQIILHFQIETNIILLREWGWASTVDEPQQQQTTPQQPTSSTSSSLKGSRTSIASGEKAPSSPLRQRIASFLSPSGKKHAKLSTIPVKQSVEQVFLRWINSEIGELIDGRRVENMDKQWRDGVLFCALVSRWRPDVINMREVTNANPRDNLELAFNSAHQTLGIRRLLAVEDMMIEKPDKRSVITYVSQFVRMFGERSPMQGREQHEVFLTWLETTYMTLTEKDLELTNQEFSKMRREFIEYRPIFNTIIVTKISYEVDELVEIEKKWEIIRECLEKHARRTERELPEPFASLSTWVAGAEHILSRPLNLNTNDAKSTVVNLQTLISEHTKYFGDLDAKQVELEEAIRHGGLGGRPVAPEFSETTRARFEQVAQDNQPRLQTLTILVTQYFLLQYLQHIEEKIVLWRTADSVTLLLRWIKEYGQLHAENPQAKCAKYLNKLNLALTNDNSSKLDGELIMKTSNDKVNETIQKFENLYDELKLLKNEWVELENNIKTLEDIVDECAKTSTQPTFADEQLLATCQSQADQIAVKLGASARLANNQRLEVLANRFRKVMQEKKIGGRLVVELEPSTSQQKSDGDKISWSWQAADELLKVEMKLRDRLQRVGPATTTSQQMEEDADALRHIKTRLVELERLHELYDQQSRDTINTSDRDLVRNDMATIIFELQRGTYSNFIDLTQYAFVYDEYNQPVKLTENVLSEEYVREIIDRKWRIVERREHNEDEIRESIRDMEECDRIIEGWQSARIDECREMWNRKLSEFESWHEMMRQVVVLSQTIITRLDVTVLTTIRVLYQKSTEIEHSELGVSLREALNQLASTSEIAVEQHLRNLEFSNEEDCPHAIQFLEEVGRDSVSTLSSAVDDRYTTTYSVLLAKMELFRRLQNFCDAVKYLRTRNANWNSIQISQIDPVQSEIDTLIVRLDEEWSDDAQKLRNELASIHGSFFQLEFDRLNEKLNLLIHELDKLRELMINRREYLTAANELITDSTTDILNRATSSDRPDDVLRATNEVCSSLEQKGIELRRLGELAEMNITDLVVVALIRAFRRQQLGSDGEPNVEHLERAIREILARQVPTIDNKSSPQEIVSEILRMKEQKERDEKLIDEIKIATLSDEDRQKIQKLTDELVIKTEKENGYFEKCVLLYLDWLSHKFDDIEDEIGMLIQTSRPDELKIMNDSLWSQWKSDVNDIERNIGMDARKSLSAELTDLHRKMDSLNGKINKYLTHSAKINSKLAQFELWLNAMEHDIEETKSIDDPERSHRYRSLYDVAIGKKRLVLKLERLNVANKEEVLRLCERYHLIMQTLTPYHSVGLPLHVSTLDRSPQFQSQISVSSIASSELERPESVMSFTSSIGVIPADVQNLSPFEIKLNKLAQKLHDRERTYLNGPKPLKDVKKDVEKLEKYRQSCADFLDQINTNSIDDAEKEGIKHRFALLLNNYDDLLRSLGDEIKEEEDLIAKNREILDELQTAENKIQESDIKDIDITGELDRIQMQMDLLKVMCNKHRKYVECDVIDHSSSPQHQQDNKRKGKKKKILVMVSNTITTIIHKVEERLETLDNPAEHRAVQDRITSVKENLRELDVSTPVPTPSGILSPVGTSDRNDIEEVSRLASEIGRAIDTADTMFIESPTDVDTLKSAISLMDDQQPTLNHLNEVVDAIPLEKEDDRTKAVDLLANVDEKYKNVKSQIYDALDELENENNWDSIPVVVKEDVSKQPKIELKTDPNAIDHFQLKDANPLDKISQLCNQIQQAVNDADKLASENDNVDSLQLANEKLTAQEKTMKKMHDLIDNIDWDEPELKIEILDRLASIREQFNNALANINDKIDNLNYGNAEDEVIAPESTQQTESSIVATAAPDFSNVEDLVKKLQDVLGECEDAAFKEQPTSDQLENAIGKLNESKGILNTIIEQVDELNGEQSPEAVEAVRTLAGINEQYNTVIMMLQDKLDEMALPDDTPDVTSILSELEELKKLPHGTIDLELLRSIESDLDRFPGDQQKQVRDKLEELRNLSQSSQTDADGVISDLESMKSLPPGTVDLELLKSIQDDVERFPESKQQEVLDKIKELRDAAEVFIPSTENDEADAILKDLDELSKLPSETIDPNMLDFIESDLDRLPESKRQKVRDKIDALRDLIKSNESQPSQTDADGVISDLESMKSLPPGTVDLELLKSIEDDVGRFPESKQQEVLDKIKELKDAAEVFIPSTENDEADAIIRDLDELSKLPSETIDPNMLDFIESDLDRLPESKRQEVKDKINALRDLIKSNDSQPSQTDADGVISDLESMKSLPPGTVDLDLLKSIEDDVKRFPESKQQEVLDKIKKLKDAAEVFIPSTENDEADAILRDLDELSKLPSETIDPNMLDFIESDLDRLPESKRQEVKDKINALRDLIQSNESQPSETDADGVISDLESMKYLPPGTVDLDLLKSIEDDVKRFPESKQQQVLDKIKELKDAADLATELDDEKLLRESADQVIKEIENIKTMIDNNDPEKSVLDTIAKSDVPALKAQINRIQDKIVNADVSRKHVATDPSIADDLNKKLEQLESELADAIKTAEEADKEQLVLQLTLKLSQLHQLPLDQLTPDELKSAEKEINTASSLSPEESAPLLAKIQELRDAKQNDDAAKSAAKDKLAALEKEAEDVMAKDGAKKKKKDKKKSPAEVIDELNNKINDAAKSLIPRIEELEKDQHLPADDKPKAEKLVANLEDFVKDLEKQVAEKQDDLDKLNNATDALKRLEDALNDAEKSADALPNNSSAPLNEFKDRIAPHIAALVDDIKQVPASVENDADKLRQRANKFQDDLNKSAQKAVDDEKRADELKQNVSDATKKLDDILPKYNQQQPQPLDIAKQDAKQLKDILETLNKLADAENIEPQVAKELKDAKSKNKELLNALEKAIPQEEGLRKDQDVLNEKLADLSQQLSNVDEFQPDQALPIVNHVIDDAANLKKQADENKDKVETTQSPLISHDDLDKTIPEKIFQLQHNADDKKQALDNAVNVQQVAPKLQLIAQQLQALPNDLPSSIDDQKSAIEDLENKKHNLENLLADLPENDPAAEELRQKSVWDLSKINDLLKALGNAVGDKLAALATFNAARKNAEDTLLDITKHDPNEQKSPQDAIDDLAKKEDAIAKLRTNIEQLQPDQLDEKERKEYDDLLAQLDKAAEALKKKRADAEQDLKNKEAEQRLHDAVDRLGSRLGDLVRQADELLNNAEAVPTDYAPTAEELKKELEKANELVATAPAANDAYVQSLQPAIEAAKQLIPALEQKASVWEQFVAARNSVDGMIDKLQKDVEAVSDKPKRPSDEAAADLEQLQKSNKDHRDELNNKVANLQQLSELLDPLESAYADVRFLDVDSEQTQRQLDDVLDDLATELDDEKLLRESADQVIKEIENIKTMIDNNDPEKSVLDTIAKSDVPALKAQINRIQDKIVNADVSRKHVATDPSIADDLNKKLEQLESELADAIKTAEEADKEQLVLQLTLKLSQLHQLPLDQLTPDELKSAEKEINTASSLSPEESAPLLAKIQELRDAKQNDDAAKSAAKDKLAALEKEAEDVMAKDGAKKKKKDKKKSPAEVIDELNNKINDAKSLIPRIEELEKDQHLPADDKPKAEKLVANLEDFVKDLEKQVAEKQDDLDKLNNATDALKRLEDALNDAEKSADALPNNSSAPLNEFKDRIAPHIAALVDDIKQVPASVENDADKLRQRANKFQDDLNKSAQKAVDDEKRADELKQNVSDATKKLDDILPKYNQQQPQPLDIAKQDAKQLKDILETLNKLADAENIEPQVAKELKDAKSKNKELLNALEKAIPQEEGLRKDQDVLNEKLADLSQQLSNVDEFQPDQALPIVNHVIDDAANLKKQADENKDKVETTQSPLISHDDLDKTIPEKIFQLQHNADDKKQALDNAVNVQQVAPKLQLIAQQLQALPNDLPSSIDDQKSAIEDLENKKHNLENLLADLPENDPAAEELRQKSVWDLSKINDLLKALGNAVGDKLAALATFNAARKNAEDTLLDITKHDPNEQKSPQDAIDDLAKKEDAIAKLRTNIEQLQPDQLDEKERKEYDDLLAQLDKAAQALKKKRADAEQDLKNKEAEQRLHDAVDRLGSRLGDLVRQADELLNNAEAVPTDYAPTAEELKKELEKANELVATAPAANDAYVQSLQPAIEAAKQLIPALEQKSELWNEFTTSRDQLYEDLEKLENTVSDVLNRPRLPVTQAENRLKNLKDQYHVLDNIRDNKRSIDNIGTILQPLNVAEDELRYLSVHVESVERQYEDTMDILNAEITAEIELLRTLDILSNELSQCKEDLQALSPDVDEQSRATLLSDVMAHLENQKAVVERSENDRKFVESSTSADLDRLLAEAQRLLNEIEPRLQAKMELGEDTEKDGYNVDAAAEVLSALYPDQHPYEVLADHGIDGLPSDSETQSEFDSTDSRSDGLLSPIPDDSALDERQLRKQRSRWRRVLRTALPLQALLVLLMGAACLVPHCDDEYCCQLLNNFAKSFDPSLEFINGPPPF